MNRSIHRSTRLALGGVALALALTACSQVAATEPTAAGRAEDPLAGLDGDPIRVMTIGNWTQPQLGTANPEFPAGAQAAAAAYNAEGGLDGRPIEVIACRRRTRSRSCPSSKRPGYPPSASTRSRTSP
jgi:branched-chain amino acid transport system substrate-binding protein